MHNDDDALFLDSVRYYTNYVRTYTNYVRTYTNCGKKVKQLAKTFLNMNIWYTVHYLGHINDTINDLV